MRLGFPPLFLLLALVLGGLVHIAAVLTLPGLAPKSAWARLAALGPANTMIELPPATPGHEVMPMQAPDVRYAFCRFDISAGPVKLRAAVPDDLWLIAFYTPKGENFYTVAGADMQKGRIDLIIAGIDQPVPEASADAPEEADEAVVVQSPTTQGIAMIRAPLGGPSRGPRAEEALKAAFCGPHQE